MIKPNLFIAGFAKCGTSSLHSMLSQHENIYVGIKKEPQFYTRNFLYKNRFRFFEKNYGTPPPKIEYVLDSSTAYSVSPKAIERIKKDSPDAKFIIICRDPFERIISHYNWMVSLNLVEESFKNEIEQNGKQKFNPKFHFDGNFKTYIEASKYGLYIEKIIEAFGKERVLVLKFEHVFNKWETQQELIAQFLGLSNFDTISLDHKNKTKETRNENYSNGVFSNLKKILNIFRSEISYLLGRRYRSQKIKNPIKQTVRVEDVDLSFLIKYLEHDIKKFQELGYNLNGWDTTKKYFLKEQI